MSPRERERARERAHERVEKRREERRKASGVVRVRFNDSREREIEGRLIDVSISGFRMVHGDTSLMAGQVVEFSHSVAQGAARVMWNRILDGSVETGFLLISR
jgi:hypothetical protein